MIYESQRTVFLLTFSSSVFTAAFGIAKYLKMGPCRLIPNEGPSLGGYGQIGFLLIMVNVAFTLIAKGFALLPFCVDFGLSARRTPIFIWCSIFFVPNVIYVCKRKYSSLLFIVQLSQEVFERFLQCKKPLF